MFGAWFGTTSNNGNVSVDYGYSLNSAATWTNELNIHPAPPVNRVEDPVALYLDAAGDAQLLTDDNGMEYLHGIGTQPVSWTSPVFIPLIEYGAPAGFDVRSVVSDPSVGYVYAVATVVRTDNRTTTVQYSRSTDGGATWPTLADLSTPTCNGPSLVMDDAGTLYLSYVDYSLGQVLLRKSMDHGVTFSSPIPVASMNDNLAYPPIGWLLSFAVGERSYPYYNIASGGFGPNFPALAIDRSAGSTHGNLYLTWADYADGTVGPRNTTIVDHEPNNGPLSAQLVPLDCDIAGSMGSVDLGGTPDFYAFDATAGQTIWLTGTASGGGVYAFLEEQLADGSFVTIGAAPIFDPQSPDIIASGGGVRKPVIATLPHTGRYVIGMGPGLDAISYTINLRSYTTSPGSVAQDMRDIVLVRSTDGGQTWGPKVRVNHDPPGSDQAMPNVAVDGKGRVYVGWYDRRGFVYGDSAHAYASVSLDGGQTFGPDLKLSSGCGSWLAGREPQFGLRPGELIGDRIAVAAGDDYGIVGWTELRNWPLDSDIYAARIVDVVTATNAVSDLTAEPRGDGVHLHWLVNDPRSVVGMRVYRADASGAEIALGDGDLTAGSEGPLEYVDKTAERGQTYAYRLRINLGGTTEWLGPVSVRVPPRPSALALRATSPNPFTQRLSLTLAVPAATRGAVRIYDVQGKSVRTLTDGPLEAGEHALEWDGRDASGQPAAPGMYFLAADAGGQSARLRVVRIP